VLLSIAIGLPNAAVCRRFLISPEKAIRIRANLQVRYPTLFEWLDRFRRESITRGYAEHDGQRIYIEGLRSSNIEKKGTRPLYLPPDGLCAIESRFAMKHRS
jgi:DNA polymerase I-like protein with 3'-5' exonuclease and polymerase domains